MDTVAVVTRSINDELYALSGEFLARMPFPRIRLTGFAADTYFYSFNEIDADWIINVDEDAFVFRPELVLELMAFMKKNDYVCCGMPDGGVIEHRFHNPVVPNAFFTIHHNRRIRERWNIEKVFAAEWSDELLQSAPSGLLRLPGLAYDEYEPYYRYFFWLLREGFKILYLDAFSWTEDKISTILCDHRTRPMLIHLWFAREFETQRERYNRALEFARAQLGTSA